MKVYVLALVVSDKPLQQEVILQSLQSGDWYTSSLGALATMDQNNQFIIEHIDQEQYEKGQFRLYGVFEFELTGLAGTYEN